LNVKQELINEKKDLPNKELSIKNIPGMIKEGKRYLENRCLYKMNDISLKLPYIITIRIIYGNLL
jgi:hypothetical protein